MSFPAAPPTGDPGMARVYVLVLICHAFVITSLWLFGRIFSS